MNARATGFTSVDRLAIRADLMASAADPGDPDTLVFACVLAHRLATALGAVPSLPVAETVGLDAAALARLVAAHFPHLDPNGSSAKALSQPDIADGTLPLSAIVLAEECQALRGLLMEHAVDDRPETLWMAAIVARACLFPNHLWQDLGLFDRAGLSALLFRHFEPLASRNTGDMKWKKFFYKQFCERSGLQLCPAPTCAACDDRRHCFGPED